MSLRALSLLVFALALAACSDGYGDDGRTGAAATAVITPAATLPAVTPLPTTTIEYAGGSFAAEVADEPAERTQGLSYRSGLAAGTGMLFVWDAPGGHRLWMKEMHFALDFVWLDEGKRVIEITRDVQPQPGAPESELTLYAPASPSAYVIEMNAGDAARLGIEPGDVLRFER